MAVASALAMMRQQTDGAIEAMFSRFLVPWHAEESDVRRAGGPVQPSERARGEV